MWGSFHWCSITRIFVARVAFAIVSVTGLTACLNPRIYNRGDQFILSNGSDAQLYSFLTWSEKPHDPPLKPDLIIVTLSGGGIRAAALAAATLNELSQFKVGSRPLTDNIIMVSSTSGGSIAAAYIAAHGFGQYGLFRRNFLQAANTRDLVFSGLGPRLIYDRSSIMQTFLEDRLALNGLTFGQLIERNSGPFFVMNATDLGSSHSFRFVQRDFNLICTSLRNVPISVGATASSAFPFLLTDVEFENKWKDCDLDYDYFARLRQSYFSATDAAEAHYRYNYVHAFDDSAALTRRPRPKYLHLADGGLVDNLAGASLEYEGDIDVGSSLSRQIGGDEHGINIRQVLIVEVNARSDKPQLGLDSSPGSPSLASMAGLVAGIPIDRTTALTQRVLAEAFGSRLSLASYTRLGIFLTQIDFDLLSDDDYVLKSDLKNIGMKLTLGEDELVKIEQAAHKLLRTNPCFARFIAQSGATSDSYSLPKDGDPEYGCKPQTH